MFSYFVDTERVAGHEPEPGPGPGPEPGPGPGPGPGLELELELGQGPRPESRTGTEPKDGSRDGGPGTTGRGVHNVPKRGTIITKKAVFVHIVPQMSFPDLG